MFNVDWKTFLKRVSNDDSPSMRRRYPRRNHDICILEIAGKHYPVKDWSMGGALIELTDPSYSLGQVIDFTIKFKLKDRVLDVDHSATIIRKSRNYIALAFADLPGDTRSEFNTIINQ